MLSNFAIIIIILVAYLGTTALGAGVASHFAIHDSSRPVFNFPPEQRRYMRSVRMGNLSALSSSRGSTPMRKPRQGEGMRTLRPCRENDTDDDKLISKARWLSETIAAAKTERENKERRKENLCMND
jgi:hypothetical protein